MPKTDLIGSLRRLETAYDNWIRLESAKIENPAERLGNHQTAARRAIQRCKRTCDRIYEGIELFQGDTKAEQAFRFTNQAMWLQRVHATYSRKVRKTRLPQSRGVKSRIPADSTASECLRLILQNIRCHRGVPSHAIFGNGTHDFPSQRAVQRALDRSRERERVETSLHDGQLMHPASAVWPKQLFFGRGLVHRSSRETPLP